MTRSGIEYSAVIRSPPDTVDDAHDFLASAWEGLPDVVAEDRMVLETILSELVTNVIQGNPHRQVQCEVTLSVDADTLRLETADTGDRVQNPPTAGVEMPVDTSEHGRGLALILLMADTLTYGVEGSLNVWRIVRSRRPPADKAADE